MVEKKEIPNDIDNLHVRLIFDLRNLLKQVKLQNLVMKRAEIVTIFEPKMVIYGNLFTLQVSQLKFAILLISLCSSESCGVLIPFSLLRLNFSLTCKLSIITRRTFEIVNLRLRLRF